MRRFGALLLLYSVLIVPAVAQRSVGFRGAAGASRSVAAPGYRGGFDYPGLSGFGGFFPGNRFFGFGEPDYAAGWDYPEYGYVDDGYLNYVPSVYYGYGPTAPVVQQSPPRVIEYHGPAHTCPLANGKPVYRIAVPADNRERKVPPTYQNNIWVAQDYSFKERTLDFTTVDGEQKVTSIRSVDRILTLQLNRECGANFQFTH